MMPLTPSFNLNSARDTGGGFVFSLYPYLLMTTGYIGLLVITLLIAAYHASIVMLLGSALARTNWIAMFALGRAMSSIYAGYSTGYLWNLFGLKTLAALAIAGISLYVLRGRRQSTRGITQADGTQ
jgi:hypothetical protein